MERQEYDSKLKQLNESFEKQKLELAREYALANNTVNIGDTVSDRYGERTIIVDKISISFGYRCDKPECVYNGIELTKKLQPKKNGDRGMIYQSNLKALFN